MITKQFLRKILVAGMVVGTSHVPHNIKCDPICRASDLSIYMSEDNCNQTSDSQNLCPPKAGIVEETIGSLRRQIWGAIDKCAVYRRDMEDTIDRGSEYATSLYKYLSEESDDTTKMAAVGIGTLTGFVLGLRGGFFRRILFSGIGAFSISTVCYPEQTSKFTQEAIKESRKIATIAYNFVYGVKKDDIQLPQLPKLPTMDDVWGIAGDLSKSASSLITGKSAKEEKNTKRSSTDGVTSEVVPSDEFVQKSHSTASKSCHCPVGACLGRHDKETVSS